MPDAVNAPPRIRSDRFFDTRPQSFNAYMIGALALGIGILMQLGMGWITLSLTGLLPFLLCFAPFLVVTIFYYFQRWSEWQREQTFLDELNGRPASDLLKLRFLEKLTSRVGRADAPFASSGGFWSLSDARRLYAILKDCPHITNAGFVTRCMDSYEEQMRKSNRIFRRVIPMLEAALILWGYVLGSHALQHGWVFLGGMLNGVMIGVGIAVLGVYALKRLSDAVHCYCEDKAFASKLEEILTESQRAQRDATVVGVVEALLAASSGSAGTAQAESVPPKYKAEWDGPPEGGPQAPGTQTSEPASGPPAGDLPPYPDDGLPGYSGPPAN